MAIIAEFALALTAGMAAEEMGDLIYAHPSHSEVIQYALQKNAGKPPSSETASRKHSRILNQTFHIYTDKYKCNLSKGIENWVKYTPRIVFAILHPLKNGRSRE